MEQLKIGFVGLGDIGEPMARRIIVAGFPVMLWARREASLIPFRDTNFTRASSLVDLGRESDVVHVAVFSEEDVREVVLGDNGILAGMRSGGIIAVHATVSIESVVSLAQKCTDYGVAVLDVPISGLRARAESGQLTVMVGGPEHAFKKILPILGAFGTHIEHLGPVGSGLKVKALNQALLQANVTNSALALRIGRELDLEREATERVLQSASGGSAALDVLLGRVLLDPAFTKLAEDIAVKDLSVFDALCQSAGLDAGTFRETAAMSVSAMRQLLVTAKNHDSVPPSGQHAG